MDFQLRARWHLTDLGLRLRPQPPAAEQLLELYDVEIDSYSCAAVPDGSIPLNHSHHRLSLFGSVCSPKDRSKGMIWNVDTNIWFHLDQSWSLDICGD